jgi:N-acetylglutamate synthase-like GNAT family acetyltransferase
VNRCIGKQIINHKSEIINKIVSYSSEIKIQPAQKEHVKSILNILNPYTKIGKLLPRDENDKGIGSALITYAIDIVKNERLGNKVFALTRRPNMFTRLGFKIVPMETFPKKIWFDCSKCLKLDRCDEVAVLYKI